MSTNVCCVSMLHADCHCYKSVHLSCDRRVGNTYSSLGVVTFSALALLRTLSP